MMLTLNWVQEIVRDSPRVVCVEARRIAVNQQTAWTACAESLRGVLVFKEQSRLLAR